MQQWKIRFQWYAVRAESKSAAIAKAVKLIAADPAGFVLDASPPEAVPKTLGEVAKAILTGNP